MPTPPPSTDGTLCQACIELPFEQADSVSDALMELGALAVSLEDAQADTDEEQPLYGEPGMEPEAFAWGINRVVALFRSQTEAEQVFGEIDESALNNQPIRYDTVPEQDWVRLTQSQFEPIEITPNFFIVPTWHEPLARENRVNLVLDPGLAFGTGSHPTTALCLAWLCQNQPNQKRVLDYGCGSGILGIAALKLGAAQAVGVDIDPQAVISTGHNASQNGVTMPVGLPDFDQAQGEFPVVLANILSNPLKLLAPALCGHVSTGGDLVLSGVLARQAHEVMSHYNRWMDMTIWGEKDGWVCLHGKKRA